MKLKFSFNSSRDPGLLPRRPVYDPPMTLLLLALLAGQAPQRPFSEDRLLLDRRLETLRRILPDGPNPMADAALVKDLAEGARLLGVEALARPPAENGARGQVSVDLTAQGSYGEIDRFFRQAALSHRLIDVAGLTLTALPGDAVRLTALLALPYRPLRAPLPQPPDGTRARVSGVPKLQADAFVADQALAVAKSETIATLRRGRRNPRVFLAELGSIVRERPVVLTSASLGDEFSVRGFTVGEGPLRALETRFERGFFRLSQFLVARQGACLRFEAKGASPVAGPEAELPLPTEDPFEEPEAACLIDRDTLRGPNIQWPTGKLPGKGPLSVRLRDVDLTDVFRVLNNLTSQAFIVDANVAGRVNVELQRATLDEALAAIAKAADLRISEPGLVRRVSLARAAPPAKPTPKPAPPKSAKKGVLPVPEAAPSSEAPQAPPSTAAASFELKRAAVRELLAVMTDADPVFASLGPQGSLGRVSIWARDLPLEKLRAVVLEAAGLKERFEDGRRLIERSPGGTDELVPVAGDPLDPRLLLRPQDMALLEFAPAGLATGGDRWTAFAYAPGGALYEFRGGDRLADATLKDVQSTDVLLETDEGELRLGVAPLR
jgi:hypothetical protein